MSEHAAIMISKLRERGEDPLMLLFLSTPPCLTEKQDWLTELKRLHFQFCMVPFHSRLVSTLKEAGRDAAIPLFDFCKRHHQDFLKEDTHFVDGIYTAIENKLLAYPPSVWFSVEEELRRNQAEDNRNFKNFFRTVYKETRHICSVRPKSFVAALKKDYAREDYYKVRHTWGIHKPFFIQTYDAGVTGVVKGSSIFYIFATASDGLIRLLDMLTTGSTCYNHRVFRVIGAYEHVLDNDTLCYPILDWEAMEEFFDGRCSGRDVLWMMRRFPEVVLYHWCANGILSSDPTSVYYKNKSRRVIEGNKMSMHFILGVLAERQHHNAALERFIEAKDERDVRRREWIDLARQRAKENKGRMPKDFPSGLLEGEHDFLLDPHSSIYPFDYSAGKGNGFSMAFSRKRECEPFPVYWGKTEYALGQTDFDPFEEKEPDSVQSPCQIPRPHDLLGSHLTMEQRLFLLHEQCYTTGKYRSAFYTESFLHSVKEKTKVRFFPSFIESFPSGFEPATPDWWEQGGVGAVKRPTPSSSRSTLLPEWLQSALEALSGRGISNENLYTPPGLEAIRRTLPQPFRDTAIMAQIKSNVCAYGLVSGDYHKLHDNDSVRVAYTEDAVLLTCVKGEKGHKIDDNYGNAHCKVVNMHCKEDEQGKMRPVETVKGRCIHWAMFYRSELELLVNKGAALYIP